MEIVESCNQEKHQAYGLVWLICEPDNNDEPIPVWCRKCNPERMPSIFCLDTVPDTQCPHIKMKTLPYDVIDQHLNSMKKELGSASLQISMKQTALEKTINMMKREEIEANGGNDSFVELKVRRNHGIKIKLSRDEKDKLVSLCQKNGFTNISSYIRWSLLAKNDIFDNLEEIKRLVKNGR
jgi:hypothetical protein